MLDIIDELKNIYRNDVFPIVDTVTPKDLVIYFPTLDLTIETDQIVDDSFELSESLCSEPDLVFGSCEASKIKFTVADVEQDLTGQWFTIEQVIDGFDPVPLGVYKVDSCVKQDNLRFKDITAYDKLKDTDINVADWYNSLFSTGDETYTLKQFRESLLAYLDIEYEDEILPNDDMVIEKTIEPTRISGREVLRRCVELNGAFGHIGRTGKFRHVVLEPTYGLYPAGNLFPSEDLFPVSEDDKDFEYDYSNTGLYPSELLYPSEDFYPIYETDPNPFPNKENVGRYQRIDYEDYAVNEIDKLIVRSDEDDIGSIVGSGSNAYIIQGNFLVFGKSAEELKQTASNAYSNIAKRPYRPFTAECIGLPYIEVGDSIEFATDDKVKSYVLQRTLTGIQALKDVFETLGNEEREQNFGVNEEIIQLKGRATRIKKDVEGVRVEVENLEERTNARFEITDNKITQEVNRATQAEEDLSGRIEVQADRITQEVTRATEAEGELSGRIDVLAGQIILKVDADGVIAAINLSPEEIKIAANKINLEGYVTITNLSTPGSVVIDGGNLKAGTVVADSVRADWVYAGTINANQITAGTISGDRISGGTITGSQIQSVFYNAGDSLTLTMSDVAFGVSLNMAEGTWFRTFLGHSTLRFQGTGSDDTIYGRTSMNIGSGFTANSLGHVTCNSLTVGGYSAITSYDIGDYIPKYTNQLIASDTGYGNIDFQGFDNAAGVNWVQANFEPKTTSDVRLKYDMKPLDLPDELFYSLKPYQFRFKPETNYGDEIRFGLIAQQVESAFEEHGLNPYDYDLIEVVDVRKYTDDGYYVNDTTHRLNDKNFIAWIIDILKKQKAEIENLKTLLKLLEKR